MRTNVDRYRFGPPSCDQTQGRCQASVRTPWIRRRDRLEGTRTCDQTSVRQSSSLVELRVVAIAPQCRKVQRTAGSLSRILPVSHRLSRTRSGGRRSEQAERTTAIPATTPAVHSCRGDLTDALHSGDATPEANCSREPLERGRPHCGGPIQSRRLGEVPEWSNGPVSKTGVRVTVPRVRIPLSPLRGGTVSGAVSARDCAALLLRRSEASTDPGCSASDR